MGLFIYHPLSKIEGELYSLYHPSCYLPVGISYVLRDRYKVIGKLSFGQHFKSMAEDTRYFESPAIHVYQLSLIHTNAQCFPSIEDTHLRFRWEKSWLWTTIVWRENSPGQFLKNNTSSVEVRASQTYHTSFQLMQTVLCLRPPPESCLQICWQILQHPR